MTAVPYSLLTRWRQHMQVWHFPYVGSRIEPHEHPEHFCHDTQLISGTFEVTGEAERGNFTVTAPDYLRFEPGVLHSFKALTAGAKLIHFYEPGTTPDGTG